MATPGTPGLQPTATVTGVGAVAPASAGSVAPAVTQAAATSRAAATAALGDWSTVGGGWGRALCWAFRGALGRGPALLLALPAGHCGGRAGSLSKPQPKPSVCQCRGFGPCFLVHLWILLLWSTVPQAETRRAPETLWSSAGGGGMLSCPLLCAGVSPTCMSSLPHDAPKAGLSRRRSEQRPPVGIRCALQHCPSSLHLRM